MKTEKLIERLENIEFHLKGGSHGEIEGKLVDEVVKRLKDYDTLVEILKAMGKE